MGLAIIFTAVGVIALVFAVPLLREKTIKKVATQNECKK